VGLNTSRIEKRRGKSNKMDPRHPLRRIQSNNKKNGGRGLGNIEFPLGHQKKAEAVAVVRMGGVKPTTNPNPPPPIESFQAGVV